MEKEELVLTCRASKGIARRPLQERHCFGAAVHDFVEERQPTSRPRAGGGWPTACKAADEVRTTGRAQLPGPKIHRSVRCSEKHEITIEGLGQCDRRGICPCQSSDRGDRLVALQVV